MTDITPEPERPADSAVRLDQGHVHGSGGIPERFQDPGLPPHVHRAADLDFIEVHVSTPVTECERRDPKGLYERARRGELRGLTGIDAPYESPESPDLRFDTTGADIDRLASLILGALMDRGIMAG